jgi:hypothetical protein
LQHAVGRWLGLVNPFGLMALGETNGYYLSFFTNL